VNDRGTAPPPDLDTREMLLQMGPSHPAMHGTVKMDLRLNGETVVDVDVHIGYLHRGFEKMCEQSTYNQCFAYADRLNYVSPAINNVGLALTIEKLLGMEVPARAQYVRTIISEISRIQDHLTAIAATALELGGFTAMLWCVEARDHYYHLFEELTGARVTLSYCRVGGLRGDLPAGFAARFRGCATKTRSLLADVEALLTRNRLYMDRMCGVGVIEASEALAWGFTGPCLRASGVPYDVRKDHPYLVYDRVEFDVPVGEKGDNYDRYLVRVEEIKQSIRIVDQCFEQMPDGPVNVGDWRVVHPPKQQVYDTIEGMIAQFELVFKGPAVAPGEVYGYVEGGNGELGFYLVSDGSGRPYRLHVRAPCFAIMQAIPDMIRGGMLADIIPTFDSINMIGGEIDR
jgi:NADH-quinone oxidoreductase subunit D